jgi:predicted nucleotidyltransferase
MNPVEKNIDKIRILCIKHKVGRLFVFGSVLNKSFRIESDLDFVVEFKGVDLYDYADNYFDFKYSLEDVFKRDVDVLENNAINNPYLRQQIDLTKQLVYG